MDNLEFCNLLKEAKRLSGKSNVDIIVSLRKSQGALSDMLNGRSDYTLSKYLPYIQAIGFCLTINSDDESVKITDNVDATEYIKRKLQSSAYSFCELGKKTRHKPSNGISYIKWRCFTIISVFEICRNVS